MAMNKSEGIGVTSEKGVIYKLYTEDVNRGAVISQLGKLFPDGFTVLEATGGWFNPEKSKTILEGSIVIEILRTGHSEEDITFFECKVMELIGYIKELNKQQCIMVTKAITNYSFV